MSKYTLVHKDGFVIAIARKGGNVETNNNTYQHGTMEGIANYIILEELKLNKLIREYDIDSVDFSKISLENIKKRIIEAEESEVEELNNDLYLANKLFNSKDIRAELVRAIIMINKS